MAGRIINSSQRTVWIIAGNKKHCLKPTEISDSDTVKISDADGLLLDGTPVLFDSLRTDLGGGQVHRTGAIKVCSPGAMTILDGTGPTYQLKVEISVAGFICPTDSAGYKSPEWCSAHPGWEISTAPLGRACP